MNIDGLGTETVDLFYQEGLVNNIADLYQLSANDIVGLDGKKEKSANKIIAGLEQSTTSILTIS